MIKLIPGRRRVIASLFTVPIVGLKALAALGKDFETVKKELGGLKGDIQGLSNEITLTQADVDAIEKEVAQIALNQAAMADYMVKMSGATGELETQMRALCVKLFEISQKECSQSEKQELLLAEWKKFELCTRCTYTCSGSGRGRIFKGDGTFLRAALGFGMFAARIGIGIGIGGGGGGLLRSVSPR